MPKNNKDSKFTYLAFYNNKTVKVGYTKNVLSRIRQLGGASSCFVCFRAEHDSTHSAQQAEKQMKQELVNYIIQDAECREWLDTEKKGFYKSLKKTLSSIKMNFFTYARNLGYKSSTTWDKTEPSEVKKLVIGRYLVEGTSRPPCTRGGRFFCLKKLIFSLDLTNGLC